MFPRSNLTSSLIISPEISIESITRKLCRSMVNWKLREKTQRFQFILGSSTIRLSLSQESEDTTSSKSTWTSCNTSRITLMRISLINCTLRTSSKLPKRPKSLLIQNIMMENSLIPLTSIQKLLIQPPGLPLTWVSKNLVLLYGIQSCWHQFLRNQLTPKNEINNYYSYLRKTLDKYIIIYRLTENNIY